MSNKIISFLSSLEEKYNTQFDYDLLSEILSLADEKLVKMITPVYFLTTVENKRELLQTLQTEFSKFLKKNIQLKFVKDYKLFGLFLLVYIYKNHQRSSNVYEIIKEIECVLETQEEELVTVDNVISLIKK